MTNVKTNNNEPNENNTLSKASIITAIIIGIIVFTQPGLFDVLYSSAIAIFCLGMTGYIIYVIVEEFTD